MATTGWESAGAALGNLLTGAGQEEAYQVGRYRSAQTEQALSSARKAQEEALRAAQLRGLTERVGAANREQLLGDDLAGALVAGGMGRDYSAYTQGELRRQEYGLRDLAADPSTSALARTRALGAIDGSPYADLQQLGAGGYVDITADQQAPQTTQLGDSLIAENYAQAASANALARQRERAPAIGATGGVDPGLMTDTQGIKNHPITGAPASANYWWVRGPDGTPVQQAIPGGSADPNAPQAGGAREAVFRGRVLNAASQAIETIKNIIELPTGASSGFFGVGASPGRSLLASAKGALTNRIAPQEAQSYNVMLSGVTRNMATIEGAGLVPSDTFTGAFNALELREGDTEATKLQKIAEMRQTITAGLRPVLSDPRVPPVQKEFVRELIQEVEQAVPFTVTDVTKLLRETNPQTTIADVIKARGLSSTGAQAAPAPASESGGWVIEEVQ